MSRDRIALLEALCLRYPDYTREKLRAFIVCGNVQADGARIVDDRAVVAASSVLSLDFPRYVSRGGYKLEKALDDFECDVTGLIMLDAGSSTGGFTDCLLQRGADLVHSVDVGYNQLDWKLRTDARVQVHEKQNIMTLEGLEPQPHGAVCDLSFRSIAGAASHILSLTRDKWLIALIKPQFETPKGLPGFTGVVEEQDVLREVLSRVHAILTADHVGIHKVVKSPLEGRKGGNTEFLVYVTPEAGMDSHTWLEQAFSDR